ncbi:MAG TPA: VOC family protein [Corynebacterium pollutisoli]|uniref:VOC family protein n=1 Tax=Corynebacterium pollutisoli TaxID=1610489 RepID=A0A7X8MZ03_9CORY|nr:VOC family protein [Corynebacterium pollutisoli]HJD79056.1 VOC family protein [Corynebacterium pollutisoli]
MSMQFSINISFPGNAAEAFRHYESIFGGELELLTYGDTPMEGLPFDPPRDAVAHATLNSDTVSIAGGDAMEDDAPGLRSDVYSLLLQFDSVAEAEGIINRFITGGAEVEMPFEQAPWGDHYGQVRDQFGVLWMFNATEA